MNQFNVSLWGDEGWAVNLAVKPIWEIITTVARDTSPPFYYLAQHTWMKVFGTSEISIRSLSFLFFLTTVLTVYLIGKHWWDKKTGFWAASLTFFNPFLFIYAFEGRMYAALLMTSTLSVYFFLKKRRWWFAITTAAALYSHHFAIFVVFWEFIWQIKRSWGQSLKKFVWDFRDFMIVGALYLPWVYPLYYQTSMVAGGFWLGKPTLETLADTVRKFTIGSGGEPARLVAWWAVIIALVLRKWTQGTPRLCPSALFRINFLSRCGEKKKKLWPKNPGRSVFLLGWFFTPLLITFGLSQIMQSIFFDRYMLVAIPGITLLLASQRRKLSFIPLLVAIVCLANLNYHYFTHPTKRPFREFAEMVKRETPGLTLINHSGAAHHLWETKYYGLNAPIYSPQTLPFYVGTALMKENDVIEKIPDVDELGVITTAPVEEVSLPDYLLFKTEQVGDIKLLIFERSQ